MDHRVKNDYRDKCIAFFSDDFRFQLGIGGSNRGQRAIRLSLETRGGGTLASTPNKGSSYHQISPS